MYTINITVTGSEEFYRAFWNVAEMYGADVHTSRATTTASPSGKATKSRKTSRTVRKDSAADKAVKAAYKTASQSMSLAGTEVQKANAADTTARKSSERKADAKAKKSSSKTSKRTASQAQPSAVTVQLTWENDGVILTNATGEYLPQDARQAVNSALKSAGFRWNGKKNTTTGQWEHAGWVLLNEKHDRRFTTKEKWFVDHNSKILVTSEMREEVRKGWQLAKQGK